MQKFPIYYEKFRLYIVQFHCHNAEHRHVTAHLGARSHELHRLYIFCDDSKTEEKSCSDCAQLTEMQRIL